MLSKSFTTTAKRSPVAIFNSFITGLQKAIGLSSFRYELSGIFLLFEGP